MAGKTPADDPSVTKIDERTAELYKTNKGPHSKFVELAEARFWQWWKEVERRRVWDDKLREVQGLNMSSLGRAHRRCEAFGELLAQEAREQVRIYGRVAEEEGRRETTSKAAVEDLRKLVVRRARAASARLKDENTRDFERSEDANPSSAIAARGRVDGALEGCVLDVFNPESRVLEAEWAAHDNEHDTLPPAFDQKDIITSQMEAFSGVRQRINEFLSRSRVQPPTGAELASLHTFLIHEAVNRFLPLAALPGANIGMALEETLSNLEGFVAKVDYYVPGLLEQMRAHLEQQARVALKRRAGEQTVSPSESGRPSISEEQPCVGMNVVRTRGPQRDLANARLVRAVVEHVSSLQNWKRDLENVCGALDDDKIPCPKTWRTRELKLLSWQQAADTEPHLTRQAIDYRLKTALADRKSAEH